MRHRIYASLLSLFVLIHIGCAGDTDGEFNEDTDTMDAAVTATPDMEMAGDSLHAALMGTNEVPEPGDPDGSGTADVVLNSSDNTVCFEITVENIAEPGGAHIHSGAAGTAGPPVVDFQIGEHGLSGCVDADTATIEAIRATPSEYYVNVHNAEYGGGAIRGQLGSGGM